MGSIVRPLEVFTKAVTRRSVVWLGSSSAPSGERPCWQWLWDGAQARVTNDMGAIEMETRARAWKIKCPTAIRGCNRRLGELTKKFYKENEKTDCNLSQDSDVNHNDLTACLEVLSKAKAPSPTVVLGGLSGRADHTLGTLHSLVAVQSDSSWAAPPPYVIIIDGENLVCVLRKGSHRFELDRSFLTGTCGIAPICQTETLVTTCGFRWNLERAPLSFGGTISTSNELASHEVAVNTSAPLILTFELLSATTNLAEPPEH